MPKLTEVGIIVFIVILMTFILSLFANQNIIGIWADLLKIAISGYLGYLTRGLKQE